VRIGTPRIDDYALQGKRVLLRVDINSPIDPDSGRIIDDTRIDKSLPTIRDLASGGACVTIIAHQGDTLDYHNLVSLREHAGRLAEKLGMEVDFIDDVAGPAARERIAGLGPGEILLLDNLRFLTEEVSTFESAVKLTPHEMTGTYLVRNLAPLFDLYVNDAFAAAHRNSPSMVAFQELMPFAAGRLLIAELQALEAVAGDPARPCCFVLGGLKISDAFSMLRQVLSAGTADLVMTAGVTGPVMLMASGCELGEDTEKFITDRSLDAFIPEAKEHLSEHPPGQDPHAGRCRCGSRRDA
jgi:phosphoglycerate kinase